MKGLEILVGTAEGLQALESSGAPEFDGHHVGAIAAAGRPMTSPVGFTSPKDGSTPLTTTIPAKLVPGNSTSKGR